MDDYVCPTCGAKLLGRIRNHVVILACSQCDYARLVNDPDSDGEPTEIDNGLAWVTAIVAVLVTLFALAWLTGLVQ